MPPSRRLIARGGEYNRLAEPGWEDPLDSSFSLQTGGRWNAPRAFPVIYLNDTVATARIQILHKLAGQPYGPEDLNPDTQHDLVELQVPRQRHLNCVTDAGLAAVGLPRSYPRHPNGRAVAHARCQPVGQQAFDAGLPGVACRSAAAGATHENEELAFYDRPGRPRPRVTARIPFADWWWPPT